MGCYEIKADILIVISQTAISVFLGLFANAAWLLFAFSNAKTLEKIEIVIVS
jgi:hypothetical protein